MKTFAEYLPTMTKREREIVEAFKRDRDEWRDMGCDGESPYDLMLSAPPAKEPVSVERTVYMHKGWDYSGEFIDLSREEFKKGDRVRVVKIEEAQQ